MIGGDGNRIAALGKLARAYPDARIVYSGGDASLLGNQSPEAEFVYQVLDSLGVPRGRILLEPRSRNTGESRFHKGACESESGRALAPRNLGAAHAARGR